VFLLHQTLEAVEPDPFDPQAWRVTPMWATLCTRCGTCVEVCPQRAIVVTPPGPLPAARPSDAAEPRSRLGFHRLRKRRSAS
jgi:formate hydrogenlyase subunit 6/NADH:ubiquinone oxidoreductase subunit I